MAKARGMSIKNREGERHGRLTVLWRAENKVEPSGAIRAVWKCLCDCGNGVDVTGHALAKGHTRSCGCLTREKPIKHGKARSRVYRIWVTMRQRCETHKSYHGRGITVCDRWKEFPNFYADMGEPEPGMTLDRIDNDAGYAPENCRWATRLEQANNRSTNINLTFRGQTKTISEWARFTGFKKHLLLMRFRRGWSAEAILTTPVAPRKSSQPKGNSP